MENDIVDSLRSLSYPEAVDVSSLELLLAEDPNSLVKLSKVISFLSQKLGSVCNVEESVNAINSPNEVEMLCMELSGLLRELYCPYSTLMEGPPLMRLASRDNRLKLLNFLISECEAACMISTENYLKKSASNSEETPTANHLKSMLVTLGFSKPPSDITTQQLFKKMNDKVKEIVQKQPKGFPGEPLLKVGLTEKMWFTLHEVYADLNKDYKLRREMLLTRLDVTILSFTWSATVKTKLDEVSSIYQPLRSKLSSEPNVQLCHLLSSRDTVALVEKTSSAKVTEKTHTPLQKMVIGKVPDRGGRPSEHTVPLPEMPSWQKRRPDAGGRGGGRGGQQGGGGGGRGGRVQGGWNHGGQSWNQDQKAHWRGRGRN